MQNITCVLLIDKRLANYDEIIASANAVTACVVFDYELDTFDTLRTRGIDRITPENRVVRTWVADVEVESDPTTEPKQQQQQQQQQVREYHNIGLMQHNTSSAQYFVTASEPGCQLDNVAESDPSLETWANYIDFVNKCVRDYGLQTYDMMACALYSNANWKYAIDEMAARCGVSVRASLDNTGAADLKGDWFLLASNASGQEPALEITETVDLTTVYFTDEILNYKFVLASGIQGNVFIMDASGIPYCWGDNGWGHLAYSPDGGSTMPRVTTPIRYGTITDAVASAQSYAISAVLTSSGAVYTTGNGNNDAFTLGPGRTTGVSYIPAAITSYGIVMQVACGYNFTMVLFTTGTIGGWGRNDYGQISGDANNTDIGSFLSPNLNSMAIQGGNSRFISIACGMYHTIALKNTGNAFTWGANSYGQCGIGVAVRNEAMTLFNYVGASQNLTIKIAAWYSNTAIMIAASSNRIYACGNNVSYQLDATTTTGGWVEISSAGGTVFSSSFYPVSMTGGDGSMQILMNNGTIYSKGYNATGIVGNGIISNDTNGLFLKADIITSAVAICNGQYSMTAITGEGRVYTWGSNSANQLGDGTTTPQTIPKIVGTLSTLGINAMSIGNTSGGFYSGIITSVVARAALAKITNLNTASLLYRHVGSKSSFNNGQLHNAVDNRRSILIVVKATTGAIALGYFGPTLQATEYFQAAPIREAWVCPFMAPDAGGNTISTVKYYNTRNPAMSALNQNAYGIRIGSTDLIVGSQSTSTRPDSFETPPNGLLGAGTGNLEFTMAEFEVFYAPQLIGAALTRISIPDFYASYGSDTSASSFTLNGWSIYSSVGTYISEGLSNLIKPSATYVAGFLSDKVTIGITGPTPFRIDSITWGADHILDRTPNTVKMYGSNTSYLGNISSSIISSNATLIDTFSFQRVLEQTITIRSTLYYSSYYFDVLDNWGDPSTKISGIVFMVYYTPATLTFNKTAFYVKYLLNSTISIPATIIVTNNSDSYTLAHSSGNPGIATVTTSANVGTVTVKGLGTTTITSTLAATTNFDAVTVTSITITVIGSGSYVTGATMTSIDLTSTDLTGSVISNCDLTSADLYGATFNAATDLRGSTLTSLKSGRIIGFTTLLPAGYKMI